MWPRGVQNVKYIWYLTINGQMRGHFKKTRFDLYLRESRSRRPKFRSGSEGHLGGSYGPYKLQIPQLTKKRAMIFKIVDGRRRRRTTDTSPMQSLTFRWLRQQVRQKCRARQGRILTRRLGVWVYTPILAVAPRSCRVIVRWIDNWPSFCWWKTLQRWGRCKRVYILHASGVYFADFSPVFGKYPKHTF